jgi:cellulose synthase/poly-beta-1,6-N-acetylglucosamine synthase-like glycosyltransferase
MRGLTDPSAGEALALWSALATLALTYLGYPLLVWAWSRIHPRPVRSGRVEPTVSILLAAYNEERQIAARIRNLLDLDYPRDRLELLVASDGSADATLERAAAFEGAGVRVFGRSERRGKPAALNALASCAAGELLVFTDARQRFERGTLRALVASFADPEVGGVGGELMLVADPDRGSVGEAVGLYWHYEKWIRRAESRVDSTVGATGAIYAIRRALFQPLPEDTILDDVLVPMGVVAQGHRIVFESAARAYDRAAASATQEFARKARTLAGVFQLFNDHPWVLSPRRNRLFFQTVCHKGLRLLTPLALAAALAANLLLLSSPFYRACLVLQATFYAAALAGHLRRDRRDRSPLLSLPYLICVLAWAAVVGFVRFARGRQAVTWERASA